MCLEGRVVNQIYAEPKAILFDTRQSTHATGERKMTNYSRKIFFVMIGRGRSSLCRGRSCGATFQVSLF
jgi:hypothetical protein